MGSTTTETVNSKTSLAGVKRKVREESQERIQVDANQLKKKRVVKANKAKQVEQLEEGTNNDE